MTACTKTAYDATELPLSFIFKDKPDGRIETSLQKVLPNGKFECYKPKVWMEERSVRLWTQLLWKSCAAEYNCCVRLLKESSFLKQSFFRR